MPGKINDTERNPTDALDYEFAQLVRRFQDKLDLDLEQAELLFGDTKKLMYLLATHESEALAPTPALEAGWHEFLMYTKQYQEFCRTYFGRIIHHTPSNPLNPSEGLSGMTRLRELALKAFGGSLSPNWDLP